MKILTVLQTINEVAVISNVVSMRKLMHIGVRWLTQDDKESSSYLENSTVTVPRKAFQRKRTNISSASTFCRILASSCQQWKKSLWLPSQIYMLSIYCLCPFSPKLVFRTRLTNTIVKKYFYMLGNIWKYECYFKIFFLSSDTYRKN